MKTTLKRIFCLAAVCSLSLFAPSCNDDDNDDGSFALTETRIKQILMDFYNSNGGVDWSGNDWDDNWDMSLPLSSWNNVSFYYADKLRLYFDDMNITGTLPDALFSLPIAVLDLADNNLTGEVPAALAQCEKLKSLDLSGNRLSGTIPDAVRNMPFFSQYDFTPQQEGYTLTGTEITDNDADKGALLAIYNGLSAEAQSELNWAETGLAIDEFDGVYTNGLGRVTGLELDFFSSDTEQTLPSAIGSLTELRYLSIIDLDLNSLPASFAQLKNLQYLYLPSNKFTSIPESIFSLTGLCELILSNNSLTGSIPAEMGNLTHLTHLNMDSAGSLTEQSDLNWIGKLVNLIELRLSACDMTCTIPTSIGNCKQLIRLTLDNNALTGSIPSSLANCKRIKELSLYKNKLSGTIPAALGNLTDLEDLDLDQAGNFDPQPCPAWLGKLTSLNTVYLNNCNLTGSIPAELAKCSFLQELYLYHNQLTGSIPAELAKCSALQYLDLNDNQLTGSIPAELAKCSNLQELYLDNNQLTGSIPAELEKCSDLHYLYLNGNQLTGSIPTELAKCSALYYLYLNDNQLTGSIPAEFAGLSNLRFMEVQSNNLSGAIPAAVLAHPYFSRWVLTPQNDGYGFTNLPATASVSAPAFFAAAPASPKVVRKQERRARNEAAMAAHRQEILRMLSAE